MVVFLMSRTYHEVSSLQLRDCVRNCCSYRSDRHGQIAGAPINGTSIKAAVPAVTTDVRYRVRQDRGIRGVQRTPNDYPYPSYWSYPTYYYPEFSYDWGDYNGW
jgi:hypothetical protein